MSANSKIEWTDHTFNPWEGCQHAGPGCDNCYAEARNARFGGGVAGNWGPGAPRRRTSPGNWDAPRTWNNRARREGRRYRVFCASLADWADNAVPIEWLVDLLEMVRRTPHLDWLMLTKRIGIVQQRLQEAHSWVLDNWPAVDAQPLSQWLTDWVEGDNPPANVWLGATIVDPEEANRDIPKLLRMPARVRFVSMEPLLGPVDLTGIEVHRSVGTEVFSALEFDGDAADEPALGTATLDWVIVGGESGPAARPMHPDWARDLRDQCKAAGVPFFFKQWGEFMPPESGTVSYPAKDWRDVVDTTGETRPVRFVGEAVLESSRCVVRVGKKAAGRLLDGREWNEVPQ